MHRFPSFSAVKPWASLYIIIFLLLLGIISPSVQLSVNGISVRSDGSISVHNTDNPSLDGYYYVTALVPKEATRVDLSAYPIRGLSRLSFYISMTKSDFSFDSIRILLFRLPVVEIPKEAISHTCSEKEVVEIDRDKALLTVKTEAAPSALTLHPGTSLVARVLACYVWRC